MLPLRIGKVRQRIAGRPVRSDTEQKKRQEDKNNNRPALSQKLGIVDAWSHWGNRHVLFYAEIESRQPIRSGAFVYRSLAISGSPAENGGVRSKRLAKSLLLATLALCLAGSAQAQDRDRSGAPATSAKAPPPEARIDINHAGMEQLLKVPGMTQSWAARILRFRPYRTKQDLLEHGVVTAEVYDRIKDYVIAHRNE